MSAVVVTHARPELARRAIESVLAQTHAPLEILLIEDGSHSGIERGLAPCVRYVRNERNVGLAASRNVGLGLAQGRYVSFIDDDHIWSPDKLAHEVDALEAAGDTVAAVACGFVLDDGSHERRVPAVLGGDVREEIGRKGLAAIPDNTALFRVDALRDLGGYDQELRSHTEYGLWMRMARAGLRAAYVPSFGVRASEHAGPRLTTDFELRSDATNRFLDKWEPTWRQWYGARRARGLRIALLRSVYAYMAGQHLQHGRYRVALESYGQIWRRAPLSPTAHAAMGLSVARTLTRRRTRVSP